MIALFNHLFCFVWTGEILYDIWNYPVQSDINTLQECPHIYKDPSVLTPGSWPPSDLSLPFQDCPVGFILTRQRFTKGSKVECFGQPTQGRQIGDWRRVWGTCLGCGHLKRTDQHHSCQQMRRGEDSFNTEWNISLTSLKSVSRHQRKRPYGLMSQTHLELWGCLEISAKCYW